MNKTKTLQLGLFGTIGATCFFALLFTLGVNKHWFNRQIELRAVFRTVGGLYEGADVRLTGYTIGEVKSIEIESDSSALVVLRVRKKYARFIHTTSRARIASDGLIGSKLISIEPPADGGNAPPVKDKDYLEAISPMDTKKVLSSAEDIAANLGEATEELGVLIRNINEGDGLIGALIRDSTLRMDFTQTMKNLNSGSKKLDENMEAAQESFLLRRHFKKK